MLRRTTPVLRRHVAAHMRPLASRSYRFPRHFYKEPVVVAPRAPHSAPHSSYGEAVANKVDQLVKMAGVRSRRLQLAAGLLGFSLFALWLNRERITSSVGTQGASVVRETISNKDLQDAAEATVRRMLEQILADESLRGVAGGWLMQLLNGMQNDIGDLMAKVIRLNAVQQAAKDLVAGLCKDPYIIQQVSSLVVSTIYMQVVQDAAAKWTGDLVIRPDVQEKLNQTTSDTLRSQMVHDTVQEVAIRVAQGVINDPATSEVLKERLTEVAADKELQAALSDSAWRVVSRSLNPFAKHPEITNGRDQSAEVIEDEEKDAVPSVERANAIPSTEAVNEPRASGEERITPEVHNEENVPSVEESPQVDATGKVLVVGDEGVGGGGLTTPVGEASVEPSEEQTPQEATPPQTLESDLDSQQRESVPSEEAVEVEVPFEVIEVEVPFSMSDADVETSTKPSVDATPEGTSDMLIATAQKLRESYRKYRDRVREAKDTLMTRWRMRRKAREDDSERRLFSGALRRLSGEGEEEATKGDDQSSMQQQTADEGIPDREEPTICTADLAESTSIRSTPEESEVVVDTAREELATTAAGGTAFDKTGEETGDAARMEEPTTVGADGMSSTALDSVEVVAEITPDECATGTSAKQDDADSVDADSASTVEVPPPVDNGAAKTAVQQPGESYSSEQEGISMTSDEGTTTQQPSVTVLAVDDDLSTTSVASPEAKTVESVSEEFMEIGDPTGASISVVEDTHPIDEGEIDTSVVDALHETRSPSSTTDGITSDDLPLGGELSSEDVRETETRVGDSLGTAHGPASATTTTGDGSATEVVEMMSYEQADPDARDVVVVSSPQGTPNQTQQEDTEVVGVGNADASSMVHSHHNIASTLPLFVAFEPVFLPVVWSYSSIPFAVPTVFELSANSEPPSACDATVSTEDASTVSSDDSTIDC